jgi:hypothetical protein
LIGPSSYLFLAAAPAFRGIALSGVSWRCGATGYRRPPIAAAVRKSSSRNVGDYFLELSFS